MTIPKVINKSEFFEENELMKGKTPYYFENESIHLFHLYYPGMNVTYPIKFTSLVKQPFRSIIKIIHLFFEIGIVILIIIFAFKEKINKLVIIINIIIIIIFLAFILLNIFRFIAKYYLLENLISMNNWHIYDSPTEYILRLIFLNIIPDFILIISNSILIYKKKDDNNAEEPLLVN
jgi:phosphoglycerol transferase MdoB-like AlkP superfamily enzyme